MLTGAQASDQGYLWLWGAQGEKGIVSPYIKTTSATVKKPFEYPGECFWYLLAVRGAYQDVSPQFHTQAAFEVAREQLAATEERAREEHWLAVSLQQAITPQSSQLVEAVGLDVAARYRPAGPGHLVSGDWYDAGSRGPVHTA